MPIVRIHCLPKEGLDPGLAVRGITSALVEATDIAPENISVVWLTTLADHYSHAGALAATQPRATHPILVDLLAPDFHRAHTVHAIMKCLVREVAALAAVDPENVTVVHYPVGSGQVYDQGRLINW